MTSSETSAAWEAPKVDQGPRPDTNPPVSGRTSRRKAEHVTEARRLRDEILALVEKAVVHRFYLLIPGVVVGSLGLLSELGVEVSPPAWVIWVTLGLGLVVAVVWAFRDVRGERDAAVEALRGPHGATRVQLTALAHHLTQFFLRRQGKAGRAAGISPYDGDAEFKRKTVAAFHKRYVGQMQSVLAAADAGEFPGAALLANRLSYVDSLGDALTCAADLELVAVDTTSSPLQPSVWVESIRRKSLERLRGLFPGDDREGGPSPYMSSYLALYRGWISTWLRRKDCRGLADDFDRDFPADNPAMVESPRATTDRMIVRCDEMIEELEARGD